MPSIISHAVVPLAVGLALGRKAIPWRLLVIGITAAMLPDADVLAFHFGVPYAHQLGHRGMTHSLVFALLLAMLVQWVWIPSTIAAVSIVVWRRIFYSSKFKTPQGPVP